MLFFGVGYAADYGDYGDLLAALAVVFTGSSGSFSCSLLKLYAVFGAALPPIMGIMGIRSLRSCTLLLTAKITKGTKLIGPVYRAVLIMLKDRNARNRRDGALMEHLASHGAAAQPRSGAGLVEMGLWPVCKGAPSPSHKPRRGAGRAAFSLSNEQTYPTLFWPLKKVLGTAARIRAAKKKLTPPCLPCSRRGKARQDSPVC